jgi:hypothetical protein
VVGMLMTPAVLVLVKFLLSAPPTPPLFKRVD